MILDVPYIFEARILPHRARGPTYALALSQTPVLIREVDPVECPVVARANAANGAAVDYREHEGSLYWSLAPWDLRAADPAVVAVTFDSNADPVASIDAWMAAAAGRGIDPKKPGRLPWNGRFAATWDNCKRDVVPEVEMQQRAKSWLKDDRQEKQAALIEFMGTFAIAIDGRPWFRTAGPGWLLKSTEGSVKVEVSLDLGSEWDCNLALRKPSQAMDTADNEWLPDRLPTWMAFRVGEERILADAAGRFVQVNRCADGWRVPVLGGIEINDPVRFAKARSPMSDRLDEAFGFAHGLLELAAPWDAGFRRSLERLMNEARDIGVEPSELEASQRWLNTLWNRSAAGASRKEVHALKWSGPGTLLDDLRGACSPGIDPVSPGF